MKTEAKKSIVSAAAVLTCVAALGTGAILRDRIELRPSAHEGLEISNLVASKSDQNAVPETKFFEDMLELLKRKYVEPINDERKLADGAVRGMMASLGDGNSLYMDVEQYKVYSAARDGRFEGIGANLVLDAGGAAKVATVDPDEALDGEAGMPKLMVASVVPGSSADKAGIQPGDWAEFVDGYWLPNTQALQDYIRLQKVVMEGKPSPEQESEYSKEKLSLQAQMDKSMLPLKARDVLMMGSRGTVKVRWKRGTETRETELERGEWKMPATTVSPDGAIRLFFLPDSDTSLREAISGKQEVTIDLRGVSGGDFSVMNRCLGIVAKSGTYGILATQKKEKPQPLTVQSASGDPPRVTLLVDRWTRGNAEIFVRALVKFGGAKAVGGPTAGRPYVSKWFPLPGGGGYTLVTAQYREDDKGLVAERLNKQEVPR